jgi:hypothetical protein
MRYFLEAKAEGSTQVLAQWLSTDNVSPINRFVAPYDLGSALLGGEEA